MTPRSVFPADFPSAARMSVRPSGGNAPVKRTALSNPECCADNLINVIMGAGAGSVAGWRVALGAPMARIHEPGAMSGRYAASTNCWPRLKATNYSIDTS